MQQLVNVLFAIALSSDILQDSNIYKIWEKAVRLLVKETGVPGENHRSVASLWETVSHNDVSSTPRHEPGSISH
jgi:hypothetical protein